MPIPEIERDSVKEIFDYLFLALQKQKYDTARNILEDTIKQIQKYYEGEKK